MAKGRLFDFIYHQQDKFPLEKCMGRRDEKGGWKFYSTNEAIQCAEKLASGLLSLGLQKGEKVSIASYKNRPEWIITDLACQMIGLISIPLYPTISPKEYEYILNQAEVQYAFCGTGDLYDKLETAQKNVPTLKKIFTFDKQNGRPFWEELYSEENKEEVALIRETVKSDDLATFIYTSGTTGNPKGVMLTHKNIAHVVEETGPLLPNTEGDNVLSFLPLCHIFERAVAYGLINKGASVHFTGTDNLAGPTGDLVDVKPVFFSTVPRLLEKVYEAIYNKGLLLEGSKKKLFFWALSLTDDFDPYKKLGFADKMKWAMADKLIFSKWREALGGNVRLIVTGAAPCPVKIMRVFSAAGIPIREGYGLTETSPTLTVNSLTTNDYLFGTVGPPIKGVDLLIDTSEGDYQKGEGEILAFGPNVMQGYYKNPEANAAVFKDIDGKRWFRTGDIGKMVDGPGGKQFLKITDRKKELLKTSGGKYVAPAPIENRMKEDFLIEQMMVVGEKQKFVSALIVPAEEALKSWCEECEGTEWKGLEAACKDPKVLEQYQKVIDQFNPEFSHIEQIKKFKLIPKPWLPFHEDGSDAELTPTLKLKRRVIREKCKSAIEEIYNVS